MLNNQRFIIKYVDVLTIKMYNLYIKCLLFGEMENCMNEKALKTLEFNKIIDKLINFASSDIGKSKCRDLVPSIDIDDITQAQKETSDALARIWQKGSISFSGTRDIRAHIKRLEIGSTLGIGELLDISAVLDVTLRIKTFSRKDDDSSTMDSLDERFNLLEPLSNINNEIKRCIISEEEIADDASSGLKNVRRSIRNANDQIHTHLNNMVTSSTYRTYLQEYVITMRNGRYCLPVKVEYKSQVPGMIHDQSSSGSTIFVEPMSVVKLNNDLRELANKEQEEIEIILSSLSNQISNYVEILHDNFNILTELDFIFAKAMLSKTLRCSEPTFNNDHYINIKSGRHPLLDSKKVVPIDINLGKTFDLMIITGPNTGGKTVSLKTVGLFTLMGQSGLHIPAFEGSSLGIFKEVFADIGDEQSIELSLSTFSSHMTNIVSILQKADSDSLVLFDELCAGTDPTEGAALAMSILTFLHNLKVRTMATTHYSELKLFALSTSGVENACCEFSLETLKPTYRLLIGIPGKSNAFAISGKLGLPEYIIEDAKTRLDSEDEAFEDIITDLENSKITIEKEQIEISRYKNEVEALKKELEAKRDNIDEKRERIIRDANEEARNILRDAKEFADSTIKQFNDFAKHGASSKDMENKRRLAGEKLKQREQNLSYQSGAKPSKVHKPDDFKPGDRVKVLSLNLEGTISTKPNAKGELFVQMGILRSQVNIKDLEIIDEPVIKAPTMQKTSTGKIKMSKTSTISTEINLIGKTTDEALALLDKYIDDAYLSHLPQVTIVHGKGTGTLRKAVHQYLRSVKHVKSFRLGAYGEGEAGVTVVEFK